MGFLFAEKARLFVRRNCFWRVPGIGRPPCRDGTTARAEAVRPMIAETVHLSARTAADELNRRGLTTFDHCAANAGGRNDMSEPWPGLLRDPAV
jgi:hypothetical protein